MQIATQLNSLFRSRRIRKYAILATLFVLLVLTAPHFAATTNGAYKLGVATAKQNSRYTEKLGPPITEAWFSEGSYQMGEGGQADLSIPVRGQLHKGILRVKALKVRKKWELTQLKLEIEGNNEPIDLLSK